MTISYRENPLAASSLSLSPKQEFINTHLAQIPLTPNQQGIHGTRDEVLSSVGAQDIDTSWYQVSNLDDVEIIRENSQVDINAVFRPGIDTPFSPTAFAVCVFY